MSPSKSTNRDAQLHEHKAVVAHALRQHAGIPYEVEQKVCSDCRAIQEQGIEALTTGIELRYLRAARFDDRLTVWARCVDLRGARFRYEYAVEHKGALIAEGSTSHATVDAATGRPIRLPAAFLEAVARAEASMPAVRPAGPSSEWE